MSWLVKELEKVNQFLEGQAKILSRESMGNLLDAQCKQFMQVMKRAGTAVDIASAGELSQLIAQGPWGNNQKEHLGGVLTEVVAGVHGDSSNPSPRGRRPSQTLKGIACFLTPSDLETLKNPDALNAVKIQTMVSRCYQLGLHLPSETTVQHIVASGLDLGMQSKSPEARFHLVREFKGQMKQKVKHSDPPPVFLTTFPASPDLLPEPLFDAAYADEKPNKIDQGIASAGVGSHGVACRRTNTLVRGSSSSGLDEQNGNQQTMLMNMCMNMCMNMMGGCAGGGGLENLQVFRDKRKQKALTNAQSAPPPGESAVAPLALEDGTCGPISKAPKTEMPVQSESEVVSKDTQQAAQNSQVEGTALFDLGENNAKPTNKNPKEVVKILQEAQDKKKAAKKETKGTSSTSMKRPSCAPKKKSNKPIKSESSVPKGGSGSKTKYPNPPKSGEGTFHWKGGKVHRSDRTGSWRVFIKASDRCDRKILWRGDEVSSFRKALQMIEDGNK